MENKYNEFVAAYRAAYPTLGGSDQMKRANEEWRKLKPTISKIDWKSEQVDARMKDLKLKSELDKLKRQKQFFGCSATTATANLELKLLNQQKTAEVREESTEPDIGLNKSANSEVSTYNSTRPAKEQESVRAELEEVNKRIESLERVCLFMDNDKNSSDLKELKKQRTVLTDRLAFLKASAFRQQKYREHRKRTLDEATSEFPALKEKLKRVTRTQPGQPPLEVDDNMSELHRVIVEIAAAASSADRRRNQETFRCCRTLDDLVEQLASQGFFLSRSAAYLRLLPRRTDSREGKRHRSTVPVKLVRAANIARKDHVDSRFAAATIHQMEEIAGILGENVVFFLSQDDKARIPLGLTAANLQAPILMRYEADYRVTLPDHDFVVADRHKLIPSVYAGCVITEKGAVSYSGPTYITIRSGKHDKSSAATHYQDFSTLVKLPEFCEIATDGNEAVKPVLMVSVDGGPDECPRFPKVIAAWVHVFKTYDLDAVFVATNAPGHSAFNRVERRMAPLSRDLSGLIFPHDRFGSHLDGSGRTIDTELEKKNFAFAGTCLAEVWSESIIDDYPVLAEYVNPVDTAVPYSDLVEKVFRSQHIRTSQYFTQIVKCNSASCCKPWRSNYGCIFPSRFIRSPVRYVLGVTGPVPDNPDSTTSGGHFKSYTQRQLLRHIDPQCEYDELPYDFYCPSVRGDIKKRTCGRCGLYEATQVALKGHHCLKGEAVLNTNIEAQIDDRAELITPTLTFETDSKIAILSSGVDTWIKDSFQKETGDEIANAVIFTVGRNCEFEPRPYAVDVFSRDRDLCGQLGAMVSDRLISAFLIRTEQKFGGRYIGFEDPGDITLRQASSVKRIRTGIEKGKTSVQILYTGKKHFVTAVFSQKKQSVLYLDSLGAGPTPQVKNQLRLLYGPLSKEVKIMMPPVQRQSSDGNNCAFRAAIFVVDTCFGLECESAVYEKEIVQREWFFKILEGGDISAFPRRQTAENAQMTVKKCKQYVV